MATKKVAAQRSARTGSYTVRVPKSATTGKFVAVPKKQGKIVVQPPRKAS